MLKKVGKIMLLVTGILLLVIGTWGLISATKGLIGAVNALPTNEDSGLADLVMASIYLGIAVILFICYLFAGLRGIKTFTKGDHKNIVKAFIWAIVIIVLNIGTVFKGGLAPANWSGLIVDAAYVVGAFFVKLSK